MRYRLGRLVRVRSWGRQPRAVIAAFVSAAVLVTGASVTFAGQAAGAADPVAAPAQRRYDGETLLAGLFFGLGPAGERYPDLAMVQAGDSAEAAELVDALISDVEQRDPGFLDEFAAAMYSGDRGRISDAALTAGSLLQEAVTKLDALSPWFLPPDLFLTLDGAFDISVSVSVHLAVAVAVAVLLAAAVLLALSRDPKPAERLAFERWVNDVALTL